METENENPAQFDRIIKYIDISSIDSNSKRIVDIKIMASTEAPSRARRKVIKGDILVSTVRPNLNAVAIVKDESEDLFASTGFCVLRPKAEVLDLGYLFGFLRSPGFVTSMTVQATGASYPAISNNIVMNERIPFLPFKEQKRIAATLDIVSELIRLRKQQLEELDLLVKSKFVEMFGDPEFNPKNWEMTTIGDNCYYVKDGPHVSPQYVEEAEGIPFISTRNLIGGGIDWSTAKYISTNDYETYIKKCKPEKGDILYTKGGTTGIAKFIDFDIKFANWVHLAVLKFRENINGLYFQYMLNSNYCYRQSQQLTKGIANRDLVLSSMKQIKFYIPPIELQNQFANFVNQLDKSKSAIQQAIDQTQHLFDSLMSEYFE